MAYEEYVKRSIVTGKSYDDLPPRIKTQLSLYEWKTRIKEHCIQRGLGWENSLASTTCSEQEYYDELLRVYRTWMRLFPYHLAEYVTRVMRITPFKYYSELLFLALKDETSYDHIPNFTAADVLRVLGIGRNEYIHILNSCKAKKLLWRMNKGIAREALPTESRDVRMEPWWTAAVVNIADAEYRELSPEELANLKTANLPETAVRVRDLDPHALRSLYRRGLIYLEIPIAADDRFSIPPLEGFVSNKTSDVSDARVDPVEALLYSVFVASSERLRAADLASILNVELTQLQAALSLACRLGFATRLSDSDGSAGGLRPLASFRPQASSAMSNSTADFNLLEYLEDGAVTQGPVDSLPDSLTAGMGDSSQSQGAGQGQGQGVAVVVDAEATGMLMMGALSPALKRHSVTLFEGGRVTGDDVINEMVAELWVSYAAAQSFEGDMAKLTDYSAALATVLEVVRESAAGRPIEILRKESLAGLTPAAACKVLFHAYCAVVPISQMQHPQLPLTPTRPGPTYFGPTAQAASPWLQLALYSATRSGPLSLVFLCGQRVWRLPDQLERCTHALLWPWDTDGDAAGKSKGQASSGSGDRSVSLVEATFLLYTLNELLTHTAVLVQPFTVHAPPAAQLPKPSGGANPTSRGRVSGGVSDGGGDSSLDLTLQVADIPLPLEALLLGGQDEVIRGIEPRSSQPCDVALGPAIRQALIDMGLASAVGFLRLVRWPNAAAAGAATSSARTNAVDEPSDSQAGPSAWLPMTLQLGMPLYCLRLCKLVCQRAREAAFLSNEGRAAQAAGQLKLQARLHTLISQYAAVGDSDVWPARPGCSVGGDNSGAAAGRSSGAGSWAAFDAVAVEVGLQLPLPAFNLLFDGTHLQAVDFSDCLQGIGVLCSQW